MTIDRIERGKSGEDEAARVLRRNGYRIIERNWRCRYGEVDLIARDGETIVFVEVKTRGSDRFGSPKHSVDLKKQKHIITAANLYLDQYGLTDNPARFDVVSIELNNNSYVTEIIKDAFSAEE